MDSRKAVYHLLPGDEGNISSIHHQKEFENDSRQAFRDGRFRNVLLTPTLQLLVIFLLLIETALLGFFSVGAYNASTTNDSEGMIETQFGLDKEYMTLDHTFDNLWNENSTSGLIHLPSTSANEAAEIGAIAMFHQLHCLTGIRKALQDSQEGINIGIDYHDNDHWPHCLDYLRKVILCYADATIEQHDFFKNGTATDSISGATVLRQCRASQPLYDRLEKDHI